MEEEGIKRRSSKIKFTTRTDTEAVSNGDRVKERDHIKLRSANQSEDKCIRREANQ
jgi:hypothetical protein